MATALNISVLGNNGRWRMTYQDTAGAFSWTRPSGVSFVDLLIVGAGGGGGFYYGGTSRSGGGGGGGMVITRRLQVT